MADYTGIFLRDNIGQVPGAAEKVWTQSPDLWTPAPSYPPIEWDQRPDMISGSDYGASFEQNATYLAEGTVYVRGLSYVNGQKGKSAAKARIYLYCVNPDDFHLPAKWQSVGVKGFDWENSTPLDQNYDEVGDLLTTTGEDATGTIVQFKWSPPALASGAKPYWLIAWVQNDDTAFDPTSLGTDLGSGSKLTAWVNSQSNLAVCDTAPTYGIHVRDFLSQTSYQSSSNNLESPDISINGTSPLTSAQVPGDYGTTLPEQNAVPNTWNYVYVRGKGLDDQQKSFAYLFWCPTSKLAWPDNWQSSGIIAGNKKQNWLPLTTNKAGDVVVGEFMWQPGTLGTGETSYTLIVWVDNNSQEGGNFYPANALAYLGGTAADVGNSIAGYFPLAVHQVSPATGTTGPMVQGVSSLAAPTAKANRWVGLKFAGIPTGAKFAFTVNGSDAANTIIQPAIEVEAANSMFLLPTTQASGFQSNIAYNYWSDSKQGGASITAVAYEESGGNLTAVKLTEIVDN